MASSLLLQPQFGGGLNGGETAFAHIYVRAVCDAAKQDDLSCACLFIDVIAAFASMLTRIFCNIGEGDESWIHKFLSFGFSHADVDSIFKHVANHEWVDDRVHTCSNSRDSDRYNYSMAEQWYTRSWATQDGLPKSPSPGPTVKVGIRDPFNRNFNRKTF